MSNIFLEFIKDPEREKYRRVFEDEKVLVMLDRNPIEEGHLLVIPKKEHVWFQDMPENEALELMSYAKKFMKHLKNTFDCEFVKLHISGDEVPQVHIHLWPAYQKKERHKWPRLGIQDKEALRETAEKIKTSLN